MDTQLLESKQAANVWSVLFQRALPLCNNVEEAVLCADLALESLSASDQASLANVSQQVYDKPTEILELDNKQDNTLPVTNNVFFAYDIHNRKAQGILNKSLQAAKGLSVAARKDLESALRRGATDSGEAIIKFIDKYRLQLAKLLTATQLASVLEGAREVATNIPTLAIFHGAALPPPSLEPKDAIKLIERLEKMENEERARTIYNLPPNQQTYIQQTLAAKEAGGPIVPPTFTPPAPSPSAPERIHFPIIDEAVRQLSEKNVITRERFDALDAAAKAKSFAVAGVDASETLTKIRDTLAENVKEGTDYETFKKKVLEAVDEGTFMSDAHMENVFRTNVQSAFSDGKLTVLQHPLVRSGFPYSMYDAIHDDRVRENHLALEKLGIQGTNIYRNDDPVFQMFRPPWDYNDRCSWMPITVRQAAEEGIEEAKEWLETGIEPAEKAFVPMPNFSPPEGFKRIVSAAPVSVRLSLQPMITSLAEINNIEKLEEYKKFSDTMSAMMAIDGNNEIIYRFAHFRSKYSSTVILKIRTGIKRTNTAAWQVTLPQGTQIEIIGEDREPDGTKSVIAKVVKWGGNVNLSNEDTNNEDIDALLATGMSANPKVKRRYGMKPGPGWIPSGLTANGVQIWLWGPNTNQPTPDEPQPTPLNPTPQVDILDEFMSKPIESQPTEPQPAKIDPNTHIEEPIGDKAKVISKSDMDTYIKETNARLLFRGVENKEWADQFRSGELRQGGGAYGEGIYVGYGRNGYETANQFKSNEGYLATMALRPDAKIIKWSDAEEQWNKHIAETPDSPYQVDNFRDKSKSTPSAYAIAAYAKANGYDAIDVDYNEYMNVLNPGALMVERPDDITPVPQKQVQQRKPKK